MKHVKWKISKTVNLFVSKSRKKQPISVICPLFFLFHQCLYMLCAVAHKNFFHQYTQVTSYRIELFSLLLYFLRLFSLCDKFYKCNNISFHFICLCYVQLCFEKKRAKTKLLQPNQLNVEIQFRKCQAKNDKDNIPPSTDSHTNETKRIKQANNIYCRCCYCFYSFYFDLLAFRCVCSSACYLFNIFWYIFFRVCCELVTFILRRLSVIVFVQWPKNRHTKQTNFYSFNFQYAWEQQHGATFFFGFYKSIPFVYYWFHSMNGQRKRWREWMRNDPDSKSQ